jgi:hypothetical protein
LHSQLTKLKDQLDGVSDLAQTLVGGLHAEQLTLPPEPGRWSIAECLVHLNLTSEAFVSLITTACEEARQKQILGDGPFKMDRTGRFLNWTLKPPPRIRVRTIERFQPAMIGPVEALLPKFLSLQERLKATVAEADGLDLNEVIVTSPFSKRMKYNLFSCFALIVTHQLRHLWQAEQVKRSISA